MLGLPLHYEEPVFRPPSEASSLILQLTVGCSWNRCTYCAMYRSKQYRVRPVDDVIEEIRRLRPMANGIRRVFLADGDALAAPLEVLEAVLREIKTSLPGVRRVGIYGDSRCIRSKGVAGLSRLRELGIGIVYFGAETGDPDTLRQIRKGATVEGQAEACHLVRSAGMKLSVMVFARSGRGCRLRATRHSDRPFSGRCRRNLRRSPHRDGRLPIPRCTGRGARVHSCCPTDGACSKSSSSCSRPCTAIAASSTPTMLRTTCL